MVAGHEYHTGTTLGMAQDASDHIGMALLPTPPVALHLPTIDDVSHQIQGFTCIMFEEVAECLGLAISGTKMYIRNENGSIGSSHPVFRLIVQCQNGSYDQNMTLTN